MKTEKEIEQEQERYLEVQLEAVRWLGDTDARDLSDVEMLTVFALRIEKEKKIKWISVVDKLPQCWRQHNKIYSSGEFLTINNIGEYGINEYLYNTVTEKYKWTEDEIVIKYQQLPATQHGANSRLQDGN